MTIEAEIRTYTMGLSSDEVVYLTKGVVRVAVEALSPVEYGTKAEAILQMLKDGWTAIPF